MATCLFLGADVAIVGERVQLQPHGVIAEATAREGVQLISFLPTSLLRTRMAAQVPNPTFPR